MIHRMRKERARAIAKRFCMPLFIEVDYNGRAYGPSLDELLNDIVDAILYSLDHPEEIDNETNRP